jgi:hypothetical protein
LLLAPCAYKRLPCLQLVNYLLTTLLEISWKQTRFQYASKVITATLSSPQCCLLHLPLTYLPSVLLLSHLPSHLPSRLPLPSPRPLPSRHHHLPPLLIRLEVSHSQDKHCTGAYHQQLHLPLPPCHHLPPLLIHLEVSHSQ